MKIFSEIYLPLPDIFNPIFFSSESHPIRTCNFPYLCLFLHSFGAYLTDIEL